MNISTRQKAIEVCAYPSLIVCSCAEGMIPRPVALGLAAVTVAGSICAVYYRGRKHRRRAVEEERLARIDKLIVYPVKSAAGINVDSCELTRKGLKYDRIYCIVVPSNDKDKEIIGDYRVLTQRSVPRMSQIYPSLPTRDGMSLSFREVNGQSPHSTIHVPLSSCGKEISFKIWSDEVKGIDQGDAVADWLGKYLQVPGARLVKSMNDNEFLRCPPAKEGATQIEGLDYQDGFPVLVLSRASAASLISRVPVSVGRPMDYRRFRPNILLDGCCPHTEDQFSTLTFEANSTCWLDLARLCTRCTIPSVDPDCGVMDTLTREPTPTLNAFRRGSAIASSCHPRHHAVLTKHKNKVFMGVYGVPRFLDTNAQPTVICKGDVVRFT